jgi:nucleoside-diphosphate-sugar epimerase
MEAGMVEPNAPKAFVMGGSGFVGLAVSRKLKAEGYDVTATCHTANGESRLARAGIRSMRVDFARDGRWLDALGQADTVVFALHERAGRRLGRGWLRRSARLRDSVLPVVLDQLATSDSCRAFIYVSAIVAAGDHGEDWIFESSPRVPSALGNYHAESEIMVLNALEHGVPGVVLRPGFLYGPDGSFAQFFIEQARQGFYPYPGRGDNFIPWVHIDDFADACIKAASRVPVGQIVHVVDDEPIRLADFADQLLELTGGGRAVALPRFLVGLLGGSAIAAMLSGSYRSGNLRAKDVLAWTPRYPTVSEGLPATLAAWAAQSGQS